VRLVLARKRPGSPGLCSPEENGLSWFPLSRLPTLFAGSGPVDYHLFPVLKKNQLKIRHFLSETEFIAAAETCLDGQISEFF
jgi:hypothetical protein